MLMTVSELPPALLDKVASLLPAGADVVECKRLGGGITNRSYLLGTSRGRWVARVPLAGDQARLLDVSAEQRLLMRLAPTRLVPPVVAGDSATGILVTEYLDHARPWTPRTARRPANIARVAQRLRALHAVEHALPPFEPTALASAYVGAAEQGGGPDERERRWSEQLRMLAARYENRHPSRALCHNDLVAANILDDDENLRFVDFEYATRAHPVLDLASLAAMNDYDSPRQRLLLDAYYTGESAPFELDDLAEVVRLVRLLAYFWSRACVRSADDPRLYVGFAKRMMKMLVRHDTKVG